jgi:hypothetical protein
VPAPPKDLKLIRLAVIEFHPKLSSWRDWSLGQDGIEVVPLRVWDDEDDRTRMLVSASQVLVYRPKVSDNEVIVPDRQRAAAESAIEVAADLIAVSQGRRRKVSSPWPPAVFEATGGAGRSWLEERSGIKHDRLKRRLLISETIDLDESGLNALQDRLDGVKLLNEVLAQDHATGRFRDLIRLFERAFKLKPRELTDPVAAFLDRSLGYTPDEVREWFETYRDSVTHADQRNDFSVEKDVRPAVDRMQQAGLDVLFNKEHWRDDTTDRRSVWTPRAGTDGPDGMIFVVQGESPPAMVGELMDEFGCFPLNLRAVIAPTPEEWWPREHPRSSKTEPAQVRVLEAAE